MREYDDHIRLYTPVLQRIIILVAVIIAVPVVLWTITAFVRTYVAPPKAPTFQHMAPLEAPDGASAAQDTAPTAPTPTAATPPPEIQRAQAADPPARVAEAARPTVTDARNTLIEIKKPPAVSLPDSDSRAPPPPPMAVATAPAPAPWPDTAKSDKPDRPATAPPAATIAWPDPMANQGMANQGMANQGANSSTAPVAALASQQPATTDNSTAADDLPAAAPLKGPVPMPRHRPAVYAMAQPGIAAGVPLPRARPAGAPEGAPATSTEASGSNYDPAMSHY